MSKYDTLWRYIADIGDLPTKMSFDEIASILGFPIDHSFLSCKRETADYGFVVKRISLKEKFVVFDKPQCSR